MYEENGRAMKTETNTTENGRLFSNFSREETVSVRIKKEVVNENHERDAKAVSWPSISLYQRERSRLHGLMLLLFMSTQT